MLATVQLLTLDSAVRGPQGIVYSTQPRRGVGKDKADYFLKGPDEDVVFAELVGCVLASEVGIPVATANVCSFGQDVYCGSVRVATIGRDAEPWLRAPGATLNFSDLYRTIVVDAWLANTDRNLGNVLVRSGDNQKVPELVMIDFEKSHALRPSPTVSSTMQPAKSLWPSEVLGRMAKQHRPLMPPPGTVDVIRKLADKPDRIRELVDQVAGAYKTVEWLDDTVETLIQRGKKISQIAEEVWQQA